MVNIIEYPYAQRVELILRGNVVIAEVLITAQPADQSIKVRLMTERGQLIKVGWIMRNKLAQGRKIPTLTVVR